jgi:predicted nucleotidyltransferase
MPTALELSREEWKRYHGRPDEGRAHAALTAAEKQEREALLVRVRDTADALKARFDVRRVILFGSLAHAAWFVVDSDVDLAVEGLSPQDYWRAWKLAEDLIADRPVDLIDMKTATVSLREAIERYGVEL